MNIINCVEAYELNDTATVTIGSAKFKVNGKKIFTPYLMAEETKLKAQGKLKEKEIKDDATDPDYWKRLLSFEDVELGSKQADIDFFLLHILVDWEDVKDSDTNEDIPYSIDNAKKAFNIDKYPTLWITYKTILAFALTDRNFYKDKANVTKEGLKKVGKR